MTTTPTLTPGTYQLLRYDYVPDILDRRDPYRQEHLAHARAAKAAGALVNVGAVGSPPTGAIFVFHQEAAGTIEAFAAADPYVKAGLVTSRRVDPWQVVA